MNCVTIVGLGLIGGSIAKALHERGDTRVVAVDHAEVGVLPGVQEVLAEFIPLDRVGTRMTEIRQSDLIVLCQPVREIAQSAALYLSEGTVVTDTGSTKRAVRERVAALPQAGWFVPSHPMAGKAQGGFSNASADLFRGRQWILCPDQSHESAVTVVERLIEWVGATPIYMTPAEHDAAVAIVSHVPQLLASWLCLTGSERNAVRAAGPAFADMTRTAGGGEAMWRDIFETNADEIGFLLRDASLALAAASDALLARPPRVDAVLELLRRARAARRD
jgi:prephenate dehydrogenase